MAAPRASRLTRREREIVGLLAQGLSAKEVAAQLGIAPGTVEKHVEMIMAKLHARNRVQMAVLAVAEGLVDVGLSRPGAEAGGEVEQAPPPLRPPRRLV